MDSDRQTATAAARDLVSGRLEATPADLQQPLSGVENDRPVADRETATEYVYGVAHVLSDGASVRSARNRTEAESDVNACHSQAAAGCYLVRRPVSAWERVPDGE